jgi:hypothetical protein
MLGNRYQLLFRILGFYKQGEHHNYEFMGAEEQKLYFPQLAPAKRS